MGALGIPTGARFLSPFKVPGASWLQGGSLTVFLLLSPESVPGKMDNVHIPEGERLPLTSFICISQVFSYLHQQFDGFTRYSFSQLVTCWLPHVAVEDGTLTGDLAGSGEWDTHAVLFPGPHPLFVELRQEYKWRPPACGLLPFPPHPASVLYREGPHTLVSQPACPSCVYSFPKQLVFGLRVYMLAVMIFSRKMDLGKRLVPGNGVKNVSGAQSRKG